MSNLNTVFKPLFDHTQSQAQLWLDASRKNLDASLDLVERTVSLRSLDDAKSLFEATAQTTRENFERTLQAGQQSFQDTSALAKEQSERVRSQLGTGLPNLETLLDPKTYGLGGMAEAARSTKRR